MNLSGKVAMITGGAAGIGFATTKILAGCGARVVIAQLDVSRADGAVKQLGPSQAMALEIDVRDPASVKDCVAKAIEAFERIDVLVNNASVTGRAALSPFVHSSTELIDRMVDTNLNGTIYCSQEVAKHMIETKRGGSIIHISSIGAYAAQENASIYCATKAAQVMLAKSMAIELAPHSIRVNCVAPGDIHTETSADPAQDAVRSGASGRFLRFTPLGRRGTPEEIGRAVAFLASDDASFITGTTLLVDGGFLAY
ncbi:MAG: SDR family NAD(P)-dependent oxidoreductase [Candidatus Acidiferrales bacterium]